MPCGPSNGSDRTVGLEGRSLFYVHLFTPDRDKGIVRVGIMGHGCRAENTEDFDMEFHAEFSIL
jgi:hypothetical protein